ncbi:MAG: hypothetical protein ACYS22_09185, partial [Planctomycetota bacterium]
MSSSRVIRSALGGCLVLSLLVPATGCLELGGGGSGSGGGGGGSTNAGISAGTGPLAQKADAFEQAIQQHHTPEGLIFDMYLDAQGQVQAYSGTSDAQIWTGCYVGAEALRFRATADPAAIVNMERSLWAMHDLQDITGEPGYVARSFADAQFMSRGNPGTGRHAGRNWRGGPARDQYIGTMFGYALSWDLIQDPVLKQTVLQDVRQIADRLMRDNLALTVMVNGVPETYFSLDPTWAGLDNITAADWAKVDDFPANLIAQAVPYDPALATALAQLRLPPVRGSQFLHALSFFRTAAYITGDPVYEDYYQNELIGRRDFLQGLETYTMFLDSVFAGEQLHLVEQVLLDINQNLTAVVQAMLQGQYGS